METSLIGKALNFGFNEYGFESRVSKMFYNYSIAHVLNAVNINTAHKKLVFEIVFTRKNAMFVQALRKFSFLHKFVVVKKNERLCLKIYTHYFNNKRVGGNFKIISRPSKAFYISLRALYLMSKRTGGSVFIISTSRGLLTHHEAIKQKTGGMLVGFCSI